jgi:hypothetical protein
MATKHYFKLVQHNAQLSNFINKDQILKVSTSFNVLMDYVIKHDINNYSIDKINYQTYRALKEKL